MPESYIERPAAGTRVLYRDGGGRMAEAHVGAASHDSPCGTWVRVEWPGGGTWSKLSDLQPYSRAGHGKFAPATA